MPSDSVTVLDLDTPADGITEELLDRMLELADLAQARTVLDAMGGDGTLTLQLHDWCRRCGIPCPRLTVLEKSRLQCEHARVRLAGTGAQVIWGDSITMTSLDSGMPLAAESFDRVLIKSASREIPLADQAGVHASVLRVLSPGGLFVNLGYLFDDVRERDEFGEIVRVRDGLAGTAAGRRHFLTREEFYPRLAGSGFADSRCGQHFDCLIRSSVFEPQIPQVRAMTLRRHGRIRFERDACVMSLPGEITVARKPTDCERRASGWRPAALERLRGNEEHSRLLTAVAGHVPRGGSVLELGCANALLCEALAEDVAAYRGLDPSPELIASCRARHSGRNGVSFALSDLDDLDLPPEKYAAVVLLNSHNLPGLQPVELLRQAMDALRAGGRLAVFSASSSSGPAHAEARWTAVGGDERPLLREGWSRYLASAPNGWSAEGTIALLRELAPCDLCTLDTTLYGGLGFLVVVEKRNADLPGGERC